MDDAQEPMTLGDRLAWAGLVILTILCFARAMIEHDPFPWWQSDPFIFSPPIVGLTPRWALLLNIALVLSAGLSLFGHALRHRGATPISIALLCVAIAVLVYHTIIDPERVLDASTVSGVAAVLAAASMAHTLPGARRMLGAIAMSFALLLTCVGIYEVFISHPRTLSTYEAGRDAFLAARGWSNESFEALSYERRLRNPEPLAWFGLTNVFASFCAAGSAALFTLSLGIWRAKQRVAHLLMIAALFAAFGLMLAGSKGGYGVLLIGLLLGSLIYLGKARWIDGRLLLVLCGSVIVVLGLRGLMGEHLGERSLLFRWHYLLGSLRIWIHDPLLGCGPGMFQQRYALLKPDLSPEDVASAHSFVFDWLATLGIGGIALIGFLSRVVLGAGHSGVDRPDPDGFKREENDRLIKLALLMVSFPMLIALRMQSPVTDLEGMAPLLVGWVLWGGCTVLILRSHVSDRVIHNAVLIGACVMLVHGMIEVTGSLINSAPLWALFIAAASTRAPVRVSRTLCLIPVAAMLLLGGVLIWRWGMINAWERSLHSAARDATWITAVNSSLNAMESSPQPQTELDHAAAMLTDLLGRPVPASLDAIIPALNQSELDGRFFAIERLERALEARPSHTATRIALSQQQLWIASLAMSSGRDDLARDMWDRATTFFADTPLNAGGNRWAGSVWAGRASADLDAPEVRRWLEKAARYWESAMEQSPHDPHTALRLMDNAIDRDEIDRARDWARRALQLHEATRLDPLRGLNPEDLARARRIGMP